MNNKLFKDRYDATNQLLNVLPLEKMKQEPWIIIASSLGAMPIVIELSKKLNTNFDIIFTQKINTPKNNECEVAIITETKEIVIHEELMKSFNIKLDNIYEQANKKYDNDIQENIRNHRDNKSLIDINGKNVLLVDEGLNTGLTMMACIKSVISCGAKSVAVAVPVLPEITISDIESIADDLYFVQAPAHFVSIDFYYNELETIKLEDINK